MARTHFKGVVRKRLMPCIAVPAGAGSALMHQLEAAGAAAPAAALAAADADDGGSTAAAAVLAGTAVYAEQPGGGRKQVGVVRVAEGSLGLVVLRLAAVEAARATAQPLTLGEGPAVVELCPWRPDWWPDSWGREEAAASAADSN